KDKTLLATSWSFFAFGAILFFGVTWIPGYFKQAWKLDLTKIGWFTTMPWALSIVGMVLVGILSDHLFRRSGNVRKARIHPIWILQLLSACSFIPLIFLNPEGGEHSIGWAIVFLTLAIGLSMAANGPYYSICTDLFPHSAGAATGIMVTFFSASGVVVPYLVGWLTDEFGGSFASAFVMLAAIVGSGALGMVLFARPEQGSPHAPRENSSSRGA
ncbi:MAG: MFS transporter, partial [Planctomycetales bacterium]